MGWIWKGCCYGTAHVYPFGFCKKCWVAQGMPKSMDMTRYPKAQEMIDNGGEC